MTDLETYVHELKLLVLGATRVNPKTRPASPLGFVRKIDESLTGFFESEPQVLDMREPKDLTGYREKTKQLMLTACDEVANESRHGHVRALLGTIRQFMPGYRAALDQYLPRQLAE